MVCCACNWAVHYISMAVDNNWELEDFPGDWVIRQSADMFWDGGNYCEVLLVNKIILENKMYFLPELYPAVYILVNVTPAISQSPAPPLVTAEHSEAATAATIVDHAITTVKTFSTLAPLHEQCSRSLNNILNCLKFSSKRINMVLDATSTAAQGVLVQSQK
ncbi:hypothetical protein L208DRAFT_1379672 [Tricholoma matsutake]|nr:hypothetical protein L208DRAFT_1379672 [Tricholoma matsutake 945]